MTLAPLSALLALLVTAPAVAAPPPEDGDPHRTVIRRAPTPLRWSPPTAVIERGAMGDAAADLPEVLDAQPGMRITRLGGLGSQSTLSIRGSTPEQVVVTLDGIPLTGADGSPVDLGTLPLGAVERVGVYRGMAPLWLGGSAVGGVVALQSRRLDGHRLEVEAAGGSFATRAARAFWGAGAADWGAGVAVDYVGSRGDFGYRDDRGTAWTTADDRDVVRENADFDQLAVLAKGQVALSDGARLTVVNLVTHGERGLPGNGRFQTTGSRVALTRNLAAARLDADLGALELAALGFVAWSRTALTDPAAEIGLGADESADQSLVPGVTLALRAPLDLGRGVVLSPGGVLAWRMERFAPERFGTAPPTSTRHVLAGAGELKLDIAELNLVTTVSAGYEAALDDTSGAVPGDTGGWNLRLGVVQRPRPDTRVVLELARSLRLPSLFERHGDTGYVQGNPDLAAETGTRLELRVQHDAGWLGAGDYLTLEAAVFSSWTQDLIQYVQNAQNISRAENVDEARVAGLEVGATLDAFRHLRARGSLTWMDSTNIGDIAARRGKQLPFRPRWQGHARLEGYVDLASAAVGEVAVRAELTHLSGNVLDHANLVSLPDRWLVGVGASAWLWRDQLRLDIALRNVGDAQVTDLAGFPLPGRTAMASLRWVPAL